MRNLRNNYLNYIDILRSTHSWSFVKEDALFSQAQTNFLFLSLSIQNNMRENKRSA